MAWTNALTRPWLMHCLNMPKNIERPGMSTWGKSCTCSYNTAVQESTKHTPFEAMYGRAKLPIDFNAVQDYNADEKLQEFLEVN